MNEQLENAIMAAKNGDRPKARQLLIQLVRETPQDELTWLWLARVVSNPKEKIRALEYVLRINPENKQAATYLERIQLANTIPEVATIPIPPPLTSHKEKIVAEIATLKDNAVLATTATERLTAQRKIDILQRQLDLAAPLDIHTTKNWARLSVGIPILYLLLAILQSGMRPWQLSIFLWLAWIPTIIGSILLVAIFVTNEHPLWQKWLKEQLSDAQLLIYLKIATFIITIAPFLALFLDAYLRLHRTLISID